MAVLKGSEREYANFKVAVEDLGLRAVGIVKSGVASEADRKIAEGNLADLYREARIALRRVIGARRAGEPGGNDGAGVPDLKHAKKELKELLRQLDSLGEEDAEMELLAGSVRAEAARLLMNLVHAARME